MGDHKKVGVVFFFQHMCVCIDEELKFPVLVSLGGRSLRVNYILFFIKVSEKVNASRNSRLCDCGLTRGEVLGLRLLYF